MYIWWKKNGDPLKPIDQFFLINLIQTTSQRFPHTLFWDTRPHNMSSSVFCVLFPCIVNSHFSNLLIERSQAVPRKKEIAFPQDISPDLFVDTTVEQIVLFYRVLGDDWKLSVLFISTSPLCLVTKPLDTLPSSNRHPLPLGLFVCWTPIFC